MVLLFIFQVLELRLFILPLKITMVLTVLFTLKVIILKSLPVLISLITMLPTVVVFILQVPTLWFPHLILTGIMLPMMVVECILKVIIPLLNPVLISLKTMRLMVEVFSLEVLIPRFQHPTLLEIMLLMMGLECM